MPATRPAAVSPTILPEAAAPKAPTATDIIALRAPSTDQSFTIVTCDR